MREDGVAISLSALPPFPSLKEKRAALAARPGEERSWSAAQKPVWIETEYWLAVSPSSRISAM